MDSKPNDLRIGKLKHQYHAELASRYQRRFGDLGLVSEQRFKQGREYQSGAGVKNSSADFYHKESGTVWEVKYGATNMTNRQREKYVQNCPPNTKIKQVTNQ